MILLKKRRFLKIWENGKVFFTNDVNLDMSSTFIMIEDNYSLKWIEITSFVKNTFFRTSSKKLFTVYKLLINIIIDF